jgi:preprotein translocase subunit SecB
MKKNYKIVTQFLKDISSETPDVETYFFVKNQISNYKLVIDITSKALKNKHVEIDTIFKFKDTKENEKKSYFEMTNVTIVKIDDKVNDKKELEKIILCDVQNEIYPFLEKSFLSLLHNSGFTKVEFEKKVNFEDLYNKRQN